MSVSAHAVGDDLQFPAFLSRTHQPPALAGGVPCNGIKARALTYWGAGVRFLRLLLWPVLQPREVSFVEIEDMSRNGAGMASIQHQSPMTPVLGDAVSQKLIAALEVFRRVEGEKGLNMLLHEMLLKSNENLQRDGVQAAFRETAEIESLRAQLKRQQDANKHGNEEYRRLQHAANQLAQDMAQISDSTSTPTDCPQIARASIQAWEAATTPPQPERATH